MLESDVGPCRASMARWFYDTRTGTCNQFTYGGCQGNQNNFETREQCQQRCTNVQNICSLPQVSGPCDAAMEQWYYNQRTDTCERFTYGGCQGNDNRFDDQQSCEQQCKRAPAPQPQRPEPSAPRQTGQSPEELCYATVDPGTCSDQIDAWYYNPLSQKCETFKYTGCGGNSNRYQSEEQCERSCGRFRGQDVCRYPKDSGPCYASIEKYYYDEATRTCQTFVYGGCQGNGNRFSTVQECQSICREEDNRVQVDVPQPPRSKEGEWLQFGLYRLG